MLLEQLMVVGGFRLARAWPVWGRWMLDLPIPPKGAILLPSFTIRRVLHCRPYLPQGKTGFRCMSAKTQMKVGRAGSTGKSRRPPLLFVRNRSRPSTLLGLTRRPGQTDTDGRPALRLRRSGRWHWRWRWRWQHDREGLQGASGSTWGPFLQGSPPCTTPSSAVAKPRFQSRAFHSQDQELPSPCS